MLKRIWNEGSEENKIVERNVLRFKRGKEMVGEEKLRRNRRKEKGYIGNRGILDKKIGIGGKESRIKEMNKDVKKRIKNIRESE